MHLRMTKRPVPGRQQVPSVVDEDQKDARDPMQDMSAVIIFITNPKFINSHGISETQYIRMSECIYKRYIMQQPCAVA